MDLFQLLGTITIKNADANNALDETSKKGQDAESKLSKGFKTVGKGALAVGKAVGAGMLAAGTAVAGLVTNATSAFAEYEQLVGGVDTLFKNASAKVQEYAERAYQTAGMSANEYMSTVTSFSASLIQSLGGDTEKAADKADVAIRDMSDNANKMGTSMEMIQNAYQGFAKQNYMMLDNLKLGYGGTKTEMERLLADAEKLSGQKFDISSYADIVDAIHVIQTEMGITGTTAQEASGTITGSLNSVKGAWTNLVTAMASDDLPLDEYMDKFVESASTMVSNMLPRIQKALGGVVQLVDSIAPAIIGKIPELFSQLLPSIIQASTGLVQSIVSMLPQLVTMLTTDVIPQLLSGFVVIVNALIGALPQLTQTITSALPTLLPMIIEAVIAVMITLASSLPEIITPILEKLPEIAISIATTLAENLMPLAETVFSALIDGLSGIFDWCKQNEEVLTLVGIAVGTITTAILAYNASAIAKKAIDVAIIVLEKAFTAVITAQTIATNIATVATTAWGTAVAFLTSPITLVILAIGALIAIVVLCVKHWDKIKEAGAKAWEGIKEAWSKAGEWFSNIWQGIKNAFANVGSWFKDIFTQAWTNVKNVFSGVRTFFLGKWNDIKTAFSELGTKIADAISEPVRNGINGVIGGAENIINGFFGMINGAIDMINKIPNVNISKIKMVEFARLATGGVVDSPTPAIFGEDGAEAVVPLENNTGWLNEIASRLHELSTQFGGSDLSLSTRSVELQNVQVSELKTLNNTAELILQAVLKMDENMGGNLREALEGMSLDVNKREFARLVKGAI